LKSELLAASESFSLPRSTSTVRLRDGEKKKFCRPAKSDKSTGITLSGDDIIGEILRQDMALIPVTVSPFGHIGGLFKKFLYGTDCLPCPDCYNQHPDGSKTRRINAEAAYKLAASTKVPFGILNQAKCYLEN